MLESADFEGTQIFETLGRADGDWNHHSEVMPSFSRKKRWAYKRQTQTGHWCCEDW